MYVLNNITRSFLIHHTHKTVHYIYIYYQSFLIQHKVQSLVNLPNRFRQAVDSKSTLNQSLQSTTERSCFWLGIELQHARCELKKITLPSCRQFPYIYIFITQSFLIQHKVHYLRVVNFTRLTIAKSHMNAAVSNRYRVYNTHAVITHFSPC